MAKYIGTFVHLVELTYEVEVEADSKEEAEEKIYDDPFSYIIEKNIQPIDEQYVDEQGIEVIDIQLKRQKE